MLIAIIFTTIFSFAVSILGCFILRRLAPKIGLLDKPGHRKIHDSPIPIGGGLAIWMGVLLPFIVAQLCVWIAVSYPDILPIPESLAPRIPGIWYRSVKMWQLLGLGSVLVLLGTLDDRFSLNWKLRILVQTGVAVAAVSLGWRASFFVESGWITAFLSVVWIVGLINSFNMLDNMNGLSAGVAAICAVFLAVVMFLAPNPLSQEPQLFIAGFLFVLVGAICGFLCFNNPFRGVLFMGDGGAYFIGFLLGTMTLSATFSGYGESQRQTIFVPICILAVPLYDMISVIIIRLSEGRSPFEGDKSHYSHRLVELGLSKTQAVLTIYLTTTVCAIASLLLYKVDFAGACMLMLQILLILGLIAILETKGRKKRTINNSGQ